MKSKRGKSAGGAGVEEHGPALEHRFADPGLLTRALTHRSLAYEVGGNALLEPDADNEQLEFVGDAVLGMLVAESLFRRFPASSEGELTRMRASLVSQSHLVTVATRLDLGARLRLGRGEEQTGGRRKPALLADALEAVLAALYLDGGLEVARRFVEQEIVIPALPDLRAALGNENTFSGAVGDFKSALQERLQASGAGQPLYVVTAESGPDHRKSFRVEVRAGEGPEGSRRLAESDGPTKKAAQQQAARLALERLDSEAVGGQGEAEVHL